MNDRILYWYEYKKWIDSNMKSAIEIGRRCANIVFTKIPIIQTEESDELLEKRLKDIFGL